MHNHIFRKIDAARLCEQKLGLAAGTIVSVDADNDGMVDGELVLLHSDDIATLQSGGVPADTVYFGDLVIQGFKSGTSAILLRANSVNTVSVDGTDAYEAVGSILPCVIFDNVTQFDTISAHFYGWKFTYSV